MSSKRSGFVLGVDVGSTFIRCRVYDSEATVRGHAQQKVTILYPAQGYVEICPDTLWNDFQAVVRNAVADANLKFEDVLTLGICTQRGTFLTWDKETGEPFHNFVTWQDARAADECKSWNNSWTMMAMHASGGFLHFLTRNKRYLAARIYELVPTLVTMRLAWLCTNVPRLSKRLKENQVQAGCIGTWLLWKLTAGRSYGYEASLASATGLFDPFIMEWGASVLDVLRVPFRFLPDIIDTSGKLGTCSAGIFGVEIPISALAADQQAAMFGCCCFELGAVKISLSTGAFVDINTGQQAQATIHRGLYPLVGWRIGEELVYLAEAFSHDAGSTITWAQSIGLFDRVEDTCQIAQSVTDSSGVFFVPAFSGLQAPINDPFASACFIGLKQNTTKAHMVRAVLEAIVYRVYQVFSVMKSEAAFALTYIRCVGGVSRNGFVCQMIADICDTPLSTMKQDEISCLGVAFLAGISAGLWTRKDCRRLAEIGTTFHPDSTRRDQYLQQYSTWCKAVTRSLNWYKESS